MSERLIPSSEKPNEALDLAEQSRENLKHLEKKATDEGAPSQEKLHALKKHVEKQAISGKEIAVGEKERPKPNDMGYGTHKELKNTSYKRTLRRVQSKLPIPERLLSRVMHQPVIDNASNMLGKTAARPSGILGGGICALLGSGTLLYMSKKYGFTYNYSVLFILLAIGFLVGVVLELFINKLVKARR